MSSLPLPKCFLCQHLGDAQRVMPIDAKTFRETAHGAIYRCRECGVGFIHPRPSPDTTTGFYKLDAYYTQGASHMPVVQSTFLDRLRTHLAWRLDDSERLVDVLCRALPPSGVVIDIGCGAGVLVAELTSRGHRAIGVERDSAAVSRGSDMDVREGSAEQLPEDLPAADAVVFSHVLEHLSDPVEAVRRAAALLKPGGVLICEVPNNESNIAKRSGLAWEHLDVPRHINFFSELTLRALTIAGGLKVERSYFAGYCRYFSPSFIATEQRIYDRLQAIPGATEGSTRNSRWGSWKLLAETARAPATEKYDSVGVVARRA